MFLYMMLANWLFCSMYAILAYIFHLTLMCWTVSRASFSLFQLLVCSLDYSHLSVVHAMQGFFFSWWSLLIFLFIIGFLLPVDSTKQVITSGCFPDILCFVFFALNGGAVTHYSFFSPFPLHGTYSVCLSFTPFWCFSPAIRSLLSGTIFRATLLEVPSELRYILSHPVYIIIAMWGLKFSQLQQSL